MYLPRNLLSKLYQHLQTTRRALSPPVLILVALEPDALCACRILARLLKHDYIPHKIQPVSGYADLTRVGRDLVAPMMESRGGAGGVVVCLGVGGMVDLGAMLGLETEAGDEDRGTTGGDADPAATNYGGVEVWLIDSHRPWNLDNVFAGCPLRPIAAAASASNGDDRAVVALDASSATYASRCPPGVEAGRVGRAYRPGGGGIVVFDDGDVEEDLSAERDAYMALVDMPDIEDDGRELSDTDDEEDEGDDEDDANGGPSRAGQKRKSWGDGFDEDSDEDDDRPRQRRRSNSVRVV